MGHCCIVTPGQREAAMIIKRHSLVHQDKGSWHAGRCVEALGSCSPCCLLFFYTHGREEEKKKEERALAKKISSTSLFSVLSSWLRREHAVAAAPKTQNFGKLDQNGKERACTFMAAGAVRNRLMSASECVDVKNQSVVVPLSEKRLDAGNARQ